MESTADIVWGITAFCTWTFIAFYFGHYYGVGVYRFFRYYKLRMIRYYQGRNAIKPEDIVFRV